MKKLLVALAITCMTIGVNAQSYFGIKAGGGISVLTPGTYAHNPGPNFGGGVSYKHFIFKRVVLEGDLTFDMRNTVVPDLVSTTVSSGYISLPMTIHWNIPFKKKNLVPYRTGSYKSFWFVEGGIVPAYGLDMGGGYIDPIAVDADADEATFAGFDIGVIGGIGVNLANKKNMNRFNIGLRASYGFLNYNHYEGAPVFNNIVAGGYISYDFKLSKKRYYQHRM